MQYPFLGMGYGGPFRPNLITNQVKGDALPILMVLILKDYILLGHGRLTMSASGVLLDGTFLTLEGKGLQACQLLPFCAYFS